LRWTAVTIEGSESANDALDRVTIPQDVLDRVAPTALPRSSIVISDEALHSETNYRTEFIVVLNKHPQGGIAMRSPIAKVAKRDSDDDSPSRKHPQAGIAMRSPTAKVAKRDSDDDSAFHRRPDNKDTRSNDNGWRNGGGTFFDRQQ
jgi:hypothetical protein